MRNLEVARKAVVNVASEDPYWKSSDEQHIYLRVDPTNSRHFTFTITGTASCSGCVLVDASGGEVYFHDADVNTSCVACDWTPDSDDNDQDEW